MNTGNLFANDREVLDYIKSQIKNYINKYNEEEVIYNYNRMTISELSQEVYIKLFKSCTDKEINKSYIRKAIMTVCIDVYRIKTDMDLSIFNNEVDNGSNNLEQDNLIHIQESLLQDSIDENKLTEEQESNRDLSMKQFKGRQLAVVEKLREGYSNAETWRLLKIPKMSYYTLIKKLELENK